MMRIVLIVFTILLAGCAAPKRYIYDQPDAATIILSQTSDISMSKVVLWGLQMDPVEPKRDGKLGPFAFPVSTRIYGTTPVGRQFIINGGEEYGTVHESFKMPPGKYKISAINIQRVHGTGLDAMSQTALVDEARPRGYFGSKDLRAFPSIVVDLQPGSINYLGSFRAYLDNCNNLLGVCGEYRVEIRDRLSRDAELLKIAPQENKKVVNQTIKLDRQRSPYFYSVD